MKIQKFCLMTIFLFASLPSFATRWSGGGGELIKDTRNPWWLENTKTVSYCIKVEEENFEFSPAVGSLSQLVQTTLEYWKQQFERTQAEAEARNLEVLVATQTFIETACDSPHDLTFQFGTLSEDQIKQLKEMGTLPTDHVSMAVRTDYDKVNLRGKGFIYIAPNKGKLKPNMDGALPSPWTLGNGGNLVYVLAHELGHVFGISHDGSFMAEDFPETAISNAKMGRVTDHSRAKLGYLVPTGVGAETTFYCRSSDPFWLNDGSADCVATTYEGGNRIKVKGAKRDDLRNPFLIGTIECEECSVHYGTSFGNRVKVWLPGEQKVFPPSPRGILYGVSPMIYEGTGTYKSLNGTVIRKVHIKVFPDEGKEIFGTVNGEPLVRY
jgi:hypothetical protein